MNILINGQVTGFIAFFSGLLSFLSPCMLPLIPLYILYFSGLTIQQLNDPSQSSRQITKGLLRNTGAFILGFTIIFVLLGATATLLGQFIAHYSGALLLFGSFLLIIFGLYMVGLIRWSFFSRSWGFQSTTNKATLGGAFLFGVVFSLGWTPCTGPILTSILILAGAEKSIWHGMLLLLIYATGLAVPFVITALVWAKALSWIKWGKQYSLILEKLGGMVFIVMGLWMIIKGGHL